MTLAQLNYFCTIVEAGSMSRAAKELFVTPSTLSISMANLEKELGVQLFTRSVNHTVLTECGFLFYRRVIRILEQLTEATEEVRGADTPVFGGGVLRLAPSYVFKIIGPVYIPICQRLGQIS